VPHTARQGRLLLYPLGATPGTGPHHHGAAPPARGCEASQEAIAPRTCRHQKVDVISRCRGKDTIVPKCRRKPPPPPLGPLPPPVANPPLGGRRIRARGRGIGAPLTGTAACRRHRLRGPHGRTPWIQPEGSWIRPRGPHLRRLALSSSWPARARYSTLPLRRGASTGRKARHPRPWGPRRSRPAPRVAERRGGRGRGRSPPGGGSPPKSPWVGRPDCFYI
jgi:hypothetical protein